MNVCAIVHNTVLSLRDIELVNLLKACAKNKELHEANRLHAEILSKGLLQQNVYVSCSLLHVYAKCGTLATAQQVFDELSNRNRNAACWNVLVAGYARHGLGDQALHCFQRMSYEGFSPDAATFACVLKACGNLGAIQKGKEIHDEVVRKGLLGDDNVLGTALVDMYAKCGCLAKAQEVFDNLVAPDVVSWTALITGYCQYGCCEQAIGCYEKMQHQGLSPNATTFACILKACGNIQLDERGVEIHAEIARKGLLKTDHVLGNALVDMYAKCGALAKALCVFNTLLARNVVSWTALIVGFSQEGHGEKALSCYDRMREESIHPDIVTFSHVLQACGSVGAFKKGKEIHSEILLLEEQKVLGNALVDMYAKCGALASAQEAFDKLSDQDIISWNSLIAGYSHYSINEEALNCFDQMQEKGLSPNAVTCACILQAYASTGAADKGKELHAEIARRGFLEKSSVLGNALIDMYAKCVAVSKAQEVFDKLPVRDVISWNALIAGYAHAGEHGIVFDLFNKLTEEGLEPSPVTYVIVLNVCGCLGLVSEGQGYFDSLCLSHGIIQTLEHRSLMVDLLGRAGLFDKAMAMIPPCSYLPAWFAMLRASQLWGNAKLGILAFEQIIVLDVKFVKAYICMSNIYAAAGMQEDAAKTLAKAQKLIELEIGDIASWNALIAGHCQQGHTEEALRLFAQMEVKSLSPNEVTFLCILKACGNAGAARNGEMIQNEIVSRGLLDLNVFGTALVDMYAKSGALVKAQEMFNSLPCREVISWTVLMAGYCQDGHGMEALHCFERMKCESVAPDVVTFFCILKACSVLGATKKGQLYFETMSLSYAIPSNLKHHTCLVDLFGCTGQGSKVIEMLTRMPSCSFNFSRLALLSACWKGGNEEVGREAFETVRA